MADYYKIIYNSTTGKGVSFYTNKYQIVDNGATLEFHNILKSEIKRFPYILCEIKVLQAKDLPPWAVDMFAKAYKGGMDER